MKRLFMMVGLIGLGLTLGNQHVVASDKHNHTHDHKHKTHGTKLERARLASQGVFEDKDVKDRKLSDWSGNWQSVNPYLLSGDLDPVFEKKAQQSKDKTASQYKEYYKKGYATDVVAIRITDNRIEFISADRITSCPYKYSGFKILTYKSGKKGVRYLFECEEKSSPAPKFIQFSDHIIEPTESDHYHIYMGNESHDKLLQEMDNWPTFYPMYLDKAALVAEMLGH